MFTSISFAQAASPDQSVKSLYAEYKSAIGQENYRQAYFFAGKAWQAAEKKYGDSKATGDLAYNYAILAKKYGKGKKTKLTENAFARSIKLASFYGERSNKTALKRNLHYATYLLERGANKKAIPIFDRGEKIATSSNLVNTMDYARLAHYRARTAYNLRQYEGAKTSIDTSIKLFEDLGKTDTKSARKALFTKADIEAKLGNWREALPLYENIYVNEDRGLDMRDQIIGQAYLKRGQYVAKIIKDKKATWEDIKTVRICNGCWPNILPQFKQRLDEINSKNFKWARHAPKMPNRAISSAFVIIKYDIDAQGKPMNFRLIGGSHAKTFDPAATESLKFWRAYDRESGEIVTNQKDLVTRINFRLTNSRGQVLDFYGMPLKD